MRGTKETIVAAQVAKDHGAVPSPSMLTSPASPSLRLQIQYDSLAVDESCMGRTNSAVVTMIAMELTQQTEGYAEYETAMAAFDLVDPIYRKASSTPVRSLPSGPSRTPTSPASTSWPRARSLVPPTSLASATCRRCCRSTLAPSTPAIFFHGPFEILDKRTSLFQLISVGRSRCNDERGIRFVNQYGGERVYQLDAKELGLTTSRTA